MNGRKNKWENIDVCFEKPNLKTAPFLVFLKWRFASSTTELKLQALIVSALPLTKPGQAGPLFCVKTKCE